jgi:predicted transcriptional regulator
MNLQENTTQTEKIQSIIVTTLQNLKESEGYVELQIDDMEFYNTLKGLVTEGFLEKNGMQFKITETGVELLESIQLYLERSKTDLTESTVLDVAEMVAFTEQYNSRDVIKVEYMRENPFQEGLIESAIAEFEKDANDGLPIITVTEEAYKGLISRQPGQHWRRFVGEAGRKLIREKKLEKVYIMNEKTERR